jgi:hypothetical protein
LHPLAPFLIETGILIVTTTAVLYVLITGQRRTERKMQATLRYTRLLYQVTTGQQIQPDPEERDTDAAVVTLDLRRHRGDTGQNPVLRSLS